jgi:PKHD-type hydroxylase
MFLELESILTTDELQRLRQIADRARFVDGRATNPHSQVKHNLQIDHTDPSYADSAAMMMAALQRSETFARFTYAKSIAPPMLARYVPGMHYGVHSDAPFLPMTPRPLRSDLSCTLFIAAPDNYAGGELAIQLGTRTAMFKGSPGSAVVYPSNTLHEVKPVTSGERLVGLTFIESMIADPVSRDLLYHLDEVAALEGMNMSWENRTRLQHVRHGLHRLWAETA